MNNESFEELFEDGTMSNHILTLLTIIFAKNKDFIDSLQAGNKVEESNRFEPFKEEQSNE